MCFLAECSVELRGDAVKSLVYEANARIINLVYGCVGIISNLEAQVSELEMQLAVVEEEILSITMEQEFTFTNGGT